MGVSFPLTHFVCGVCLHFTRHISGTMSILHVSQHAKSKNMACFKPCLCDFWYLGSTHRHKMVALQVENLSDKPLFRGRSNPSTERLVLLSQIAKLKRPLMFYPKSITN